MYGAPINTVSPLSVAPGATVGFGTSGEPYSSIKTETYLYRIHRRCREPYSNLDWQRTIIAKVKQKAAN